MPAAGMFSSELSFFGRNVTFLALIKAMEMGHCCSRWMEAVRM